MLVVFDIKSVIGSLQILAKRFLHGVLMAT